MWLRMSLQPKAKELEMESAQLQVCAQLGTPSAFGSCTVLCSQGGQSS